MVRWAFFLNLFSALILWCWELLMKSQELSGRDSNSSASDFNFPKQLPEMSSFSERDWQWSQKRRQLQRNLSTQTGRFPLTLCRMSSWQQMMRGGGKKSDLSLTLVIAVKQLQISKLLLSAGISCQLDFFFFFFGRVTCAGFACTMPPSCPRSL